MLADDAAGSEESFPGHVNLGQLLCTDSDDGAGGGCGGSEASITCLDVTGITPTSLDEDTTNVDAFQDQCRDPVTGAVTGIEPFGDHNANVTW